jgi:hypothetical protein
MPVTGNLPARPVIDPVANDVGTLLVGTYDGTQSSITADHTAGRQYNMPQRMRPNVARLSDKSVAARNRK